MMNDKVRMAVTLLPVLLVPLFNERNRIKEHPDVQKLGTASNAVYGTAKDKGTHAARAVKNASTSTYHTGKSAVSTVSGVISDKRQETAYKKDIKSYQKSVKEEDALLRQFEKEKEKHRKNRLSDQSKVKVPKIMQSHTQPDNEDKSDLMTVESDHLGTSAPEPEVYAGKKSNPDNYGIAAEYSVDQSHNRAGLDETEEDSSEVYTEKKSNPDNYGIAAEYYEDQSHNRATLDENDENRLDLNDEENFHNNNNTEKGMDNMTESINPYIEEKVKGHPEESYEAGDLFKKHKQALDPRGTSYAKTPETEKDDSLFNRHRELQEQKVTAHGRKTGVPSAMSKSKHQKKLEKKINRHLDKHHS
ncbi:hypothetical protein [Salinicoccus sp. HZC-1]|uniref:hypothetical protein n=1 Tax=Salinicoccus sp. HZC-1 TaxID=3385497 RepID=UPI00398B8474